MQGRTRPRHDLGFAASHALALAIAFAFNAAMTATANAQVADTAAVDTAASPPFKIHGVATASTVMALEADPKTKVVGFLAGRLTLRFQPDFSFWTEGLLGISGPSGKICRGGGYSPCAEGEFGRRTYHAFYVGMETRLAGLRIERGRKLLFGAGIGFMGLKHANSIETLDHGSVQASLAYEFPLTGKMGARLATVGYFSESPGAHKAMNGIWEIVGLQGGITFGN